MLEVLIPTVQGCKSVNTLGLWVQELLCNSERAAALLATTPVSTSVPSANLNSTYVQPPGRRVFTTCPLPLARLTVNPVSPALLLPCL